MLHVVDLTRVPYRVKRVDTPGCERLDTVVFSDDNKTWWLTCIGSQKLLIGDAVTDTVTGEIALPEPGPHGLDLHPGLDRLIVTNLGESLQDFGETVTIIEARTGAVLSTHKVSLQPSPSHVGPSEVRFLRRTDPPMAYITLNLGGAERMGALWAATWNPDKRDFEVQEVFDFAPTGGSLPVAMGANSDESLLFVATIRPGQFNIFDISGDPLKPKLLKTLPAGQGAHHAALTPDERYAFVQNGVLNLPGLSDGAITVIDMEKLEVIDTIDTFKDAGYAINHILMLPD